jgi:hypothetical protein
MRFNSGAIIDFDYGYFIEAAILSCFLEDEDDILIFPYLKVNKKNAFVEEREVFADYDTIWYRAKNYYDLVQIIKRDPITYECLVISRKERSLENYKYSLWVDEHAVFDGEELRSLKIIDEKELGAFEKIIQPKIKSLYIDELVIPREESEDDDW